MEQTVGSTSGARDSPCTSNIDDGVTAVTEDDGKIGEKSTRYDPSLMRDKSNTTTGKGALLHMTKSSLGTGILAMPNAFKNGGLIFSLIGTAVIGVLCTHCIYLLVHCSQTLARRTRKPALGFSATADAAFSNGPSRFHAWAPFAREFVNVALFCTYYFGACVYVILVATTFKQVAENHTPPEWHFPIRIWILSLALPLLPLGIIRSLRLLVPFSAVATTFILVGLGCTLLSVVTGESPFASKETVAIPLPDIGSRPWIAPIGHMPLFFATVLFAMEGIGTVLPIENSMSNPRLFLRGCPCGVLYVCMTLIMFLYSTVGFLGYLRFGDSTEGSITLNLANDLFAEVIKIMVALSILFSYGLQFSVPSEIVWTRLEPWLRKPKQDIVNSTYDNDSMSTASTSTIVTTDITSTSTAVINDQVQPEIESEEQKKSLDWAYYAMRGSMILGTVCIATLVPNLAPFISLIGAVFFSILGLFCPAVIHLATFWEHSDENDDDSSTEHDLDCNYQDNDRILDNNPRLTNRLNRLTIVKDFAIILIAFIALVSGTYVSMINILAFPSKQKFIF